MEVSDLMQAALILLGTALVWSVIVLALGAIASWITGLNMLDPRDRSTISRTTIGLVFGWLGVFVLFVCVFIGVPMSLDTAVGDRTGIVPVRLVLIGSAWAATLVIAFGVWARRHYGGSPDEDGT